MMTWHQAHLFETRPREKLCPCSSPLSRQLRTAVTTRGGTQRQFSRATRFSQLPWALAGLRWRPLPAPKPETPSSLNLMTSLLHADCGFWSLAEGSSSLQHHRGWRLWTSTLRSRRCAPYQCAWILVASGPARFRMPFTRCKKTSCTTSYPGTAVYALASAGNHEERPGPSGSAPLVEAGDGTVFLGSWDRRAPVLVRDARARHAV